MGRSRGGLTSKIHEIVDAEGCPINLCLTGGQVADCTQAAGLMANIKERRTLLADKAYETDAIRKTAADNKIWANIPPKSNRKDVFAFSPWVYRQRNLVERFFKRVKQDRGIATRYDKNPATFSQQSNSSLSVSGVQVYKSTP